MKDLAKTAVAVIVAAAVCVGAYLLFWGVNRDSTNRQDRINRERFNFQETYRGVIDRDVIEVLKLDTLLTQPDLTADQKATIGAQRAGLVNAMCSALGKLTTPYSGPNAAVATKECSTR